MHTFLGHNCNITRSIVHFTWITTHASWTITQIHRSDKDTRRKKNYKYASTHITVPQARTSVWNNKRDQKFEFDWQHMFQKSHNS